MLTWINITVINFDHEDWWPDITCTFDAPKPWTLQFLRFAKLIFSIELWTGCRFLSFIATCKRCISHKSSNGWILVRCARKLESNYESLNMVFKGFKGCLGNSSMLPIPLSQILFDNKRMPEIQWLFAIDTWCVGFVLAWLMKTSHWYVTDERHGLTW